MSWVERMKKMIGEGGGKVSINNPKIKQFFSIFIGLILEFHYILLINKDI